MEDLPPRPVQSQMPTATAAGNNPEVESAMERQEEARTIRYAVGKLNEFLQWFIAVLEVTLLIRFCLKLIGAAPSNLFAGFIYALTEIILFPFAGIVPSSTVSGQRQAFEWQVLIAIIIYWLLFWAIRRFLRILVSNPEEPAS
jgi:uncharacterized protein YggT (Ycf19 family)